MQAPRGRSLWGVAFATALLCAGSGCADSPFGPHCVGEEAGDEAVGTGSDHSLPGGGSVRIGSLELDDDPPTVNLSLGDATEDERQNALDMQLGDTFELQGSSYELVGACEGERDVVYLDQVD